MAWRRPGDKPLSEPMMVRLPTHLSCLTRPQWVKGRKLFINSFYRQPSGDTKEQVKFYNNKLSEISKIASSHDHIILGGDYNFKDIDWTNCSTQPGSVNRLACEDFF